MSDEMSHEDKSLLQTLYKALGIALGDPSPPVDAPIEEELLIKEHNSKIESAVLQKGKEQRKCLEVLMEPMRRDAHGNWYTPETLVKARDSYEKNKAIIPANLFHLFETESFEIESTYILEEDTYFEAIDDTLVKGTWMAWTHYIDDDVWELKKSGELGGLSPACYADVNEETLEAYHVAFTKEDLYRYREEE